MGVPTNNGDVSKIKMGNQPIIGKSTMIGILWVLIIIFNQNNKDNGCSSFPCKNARLTRASAES